MLLLQWVIKIYEGRMPYCNLAHALRQILLMTTFGSKQLNEANNSISINEQL